MPFPDHHITITGGCHCGAVRYKISVPELSQRPLRPHSSSSDPVRFPFICTDHCNDCRRASGSILPAWLCATFDMTTASVVKRSSVLSAADGIKRRPTKDETRGPWLPASGVFAPGPESKDSFLTFYESSPGKRRFFCERCGTNLAFVSVSNSLQGYPAMFDVFLGSVDIEDLETEALKPEREFWWDYGIPWVQHLCLHGTGIPRHPVDKADEYVKS